MKLAVSQTLIGTTADDILLFEKKKVIMIRKLSISRSTYLLKRRVSFLLITTGYTSHVFFFTTECCDFGDRQPCKTVTEKFGFLAVTDNSTIYL